MSKIKEKKNENFYYMKNGQDIDQKVLRKNEEKKKREREKRIQNKKKEKEFNIEDEAVIKMTNKNNLKKEAIHRKKMLIEEKKKQKRRKRIILITKIVLIIGIVSGGTIFAMTSPIFNIKELQVLNNEIVSSEEIISLSGLKTNENIFKFIKENVKEKIKENAYIEDVKIHRKIPNIIQIEIIERKPKYSVDFMGKYAYINTQGYILEISDDNKGLPIIQGVHTSEEEIIPNKRLATDDLVALEDIIKIMNIAKENNLDNKVTSIDISEKNSYSIYVEEEKKRIHLGDNSNLSNKILYAIAIIEQEKGKEGDIYVHGDLNNKFQPYFREKV